jgi:hypothetical protein
MTKDPMGESVDPNLYRFVGNSPNNWVDPLGLAPWCGDDKNPWVPESPFGCYFGEACMKHDVCYDGRGSDENKSKRQCDNEFCKNLSKSCLPYTEPTQFSNCMTAAAIYCVAVIEFGSEAFINAKMKRYFMQGNNK